MDAAQAKPAESSNLRESLRALNDYARALAEINLYTTEALQARLEAVEARIDLSNRLLIGSTALA
jgi:hypothetical protein